MISNAGPSLVGQCRRLGSTWRKLHQGNRGGLTCMLQDLESVAHRVLIAWFGMHLYLPP